MTIKLSARILKDIGNRPVQTQYGALCYRIEDSEAQVLLVTSRGTGRWVIPKGWPMTKFDGPGTAAMEALEEAGVVGICGKHSIGQFLYPKLRPNKGDILCLVEVYPLRVQRVLSKFPECTQRRRKWFSPRKASLKVNERDLARIFRKFNPRVLHQDILRA